VPKRLTQEPSGAMSGAAPVLVGVGQCGIQLCEQYWRLADAEFAAMADGGGGGDAGKALPAIGRLGHDGGQWPLFYGDDRAHTVLVDSEPKVIQAIVDPESRARVRCVNAGSCVFEQGGRGGAHRTRPAPLLPPRALVLRQYLSLPAVCAARCDGAGGCRQQLGVGLQPRATVPASRGPAVRAGDEPAASQGVSQARSLLCVCV
jgi:hypothetical protein